MDGLSRENYYFVILCKILLLLLRFYTVAFVVCAVDSQASRYGGPAWYQLDADRRALQIKVEALLPNVDPVNILGFQCDFES